jgi:hypothetical protein
MLKLAILKPRFEDNEIVAWVPLFESERDQFERELIGYVFKSLGSKDSYKPEEIRAAFEAAFNQYKTVFKEKTVTLP